MYYANAKILFTKGQKIWVQGYRVSANFRDAIGRQSSAVHAPCLNHLAVSRMVAETRDPRNSNFFPAFKVWIHFNAVILVSEKA